MVNRTERTEMKNGVRNRLEKYGFYGEMFVFQSFVPVNPQAMMTENR